jgi:hypothetical protein
MLAMLAMLDFFTTILAYLQTTTPRSPCGLMWILLDWTRKFLACGQKRAKAYTRYSRIQISMTCEGYGRCSTVMGKKGLSPNIHRFGKTVEQTGSEPMAVRQCRQFFCMHGMVAIIVKIFKCYEKCPSEPSIKKIHKKCKQFFASYGSTLVNS